MSSVKKQYTRIYKLKKKVENIKIIYAFSVTLYTSLVIGCIATIGSQYFS